jgi:hypothetical protein
MVADTVAEAALMEAVVAPTAAEAGFMAAVAEAGEASIAVVAAEVVSAAARAADTAAAAGAWVLLPARVLEAVRAGAVSAVAAEAVQWPLAARVATASGILLAGPAAAHRPPEQREILADHSAARVVRQTPMADGIHLAGPAAAALREEHRARPGQVSEEARRRHRTAGLVRERARVEVSRIRRDLDSIAALRLSDILDFPIQRLAADSEAPGWAIPASAMRDLAPVARLAGRLAARRSAIVDLVDSATEDLAMDADLAATGADLGAAASAAASVGVSDLDGD